MISVSHQTNSSIFSASNLKKNKQDRSVDFVNFSIAANARQVANLDSSFLASEAKFSQSAQIGFPNSSIIAPNQAYGYSVDEKGFMGEDFNKAAGLPQGYKLHKSTLDEIGKFNEDNHISSLLGLKGNGTKIFENIDMADTIRQYYKIFDQIIKTSKDIYTQQDLNYLPKGLSMQLDFESKKIGGLLKVENTKITNVFKTTQQYTQAYDLSKDLEVAGVSFIVRKLDFSKEAMQKNNPNKAYNYDPDMSVYDRGDEGYAKEGVFVAFLKSYRPFASSGGDTRLTPEIKAQSIAMVKGTVNGYDATIDEIINGTKDMRQIIKSRINSELYKELMGIKDKNDADEISNSLNARIDRLFKETAV